MMTTTHISILAKLLIITGISTSGIRPRCKSTFLFNRNNPNNNEIYSKAWQTPCSTQLQHICNKTIILSNIQMMPFSSGLRINKTEWPKDGLLQQILSVALAECCGTCLNLTIKDAGNRSNLISITNKESSDILLPIFSQGHQYQLNSSLPLMNIPVIQLSSAIFITKSSISATIFAEEVVKAIIDIWPLLGVAILLAYVVGVLLWIIDTWSNKEHFPRRFITGAFEGTS